MHQHSPAEPAPRSQALDGLRGIAALCVVYYHAILHNDVTLVGRVLYVPIQMLQDSRDIWTKVALVIFDGSLAVDIFFALSGYVLTLSLNRKRDDTICSAAAAFFTARVLRLYPPVIVCMAFFYALTFLRIPGFPQFTFHQFWTNAALYQTVMHGPSGTVQGELLAAPFVFIAWVLKERWGLLGIVACLVYGALAIETAPLVLWLPNMHGYLIVFLCGMAAAAAPRSLIRFRPWALLAILVLLYAPHLFYPATLRVRLVVNVAMCAVLILFVANHGSRSLDRLLTSAFAQKLGRISFSFYLLNVPVLYLIWSVTDQWNWPRQHALEAGLVVGTVSAIATWPLAVWSERLVEQPSIRLARRLQSRGRQPA